MCSPVKKHDDKEELNNNIINNPSDLYREGKTKSKMKKKVFKSAFAAAAIAAVCLGSYRAYSSYMASNISGDDMLFSENVEALSACDITLNGKVVFQCVGENGSCCGSYKKFGQTVTASCSGKKVVG